MGSSCASNHGLFRHFRSLCLLLALAPLAASAQTVRVYVTNAAGDNVHVIDPATNKVVQVIKGVESAHGVTFSPDGARVYISNEHDSTLDVLDRKTRRGHQADSPEQPPEQHRHHQRRQAHRGRHRARARGAGHHRYGVAHPDQEHPDEWPPAQYLHHA